MAWLLEPQANPIEIRLGDLEEKVFRHNKHPKHLPL
jgi:hypothetical protein